MKTRSIILALGDLVAIAAFVVVGQQFHGTLAGETGALRWVGQVAALFVPFAVLAWLLGAYAPAASPSRRDAFAIVWRAAVAWLFAAPLGLVIRSLVLGEAAFAMIFAMVALITGGLFLVIWRAAFAIVSLIRQPKMQPA